MKNFILIVLLLLHTAASSGTVISAHYCMGSFASLGIGEKHAIGCETCGMEDENCCHDDIKVIKIDGIQKLINTTSNLIPRQLFLISEQLYFPSSQTTSIEKRGFTFCPIKLNDGPPIFLLNCNFRI